MERGMRVDLEILAHHLDTLSLWTGTLLDIPPTHDPFGGLFCVKKG